MLDESLRLRLEALNRGALPVSVAQKATSRAAQMTPSKAATSRPSPLRPGIVKPIPGLVRRGELVTNDIGEHWRVCIPVEDLWPGGPGLVRKRHSTLMSGSTASTPRVPVVDKDHAPLASFVQAFPERALLLDLETCGFAGSAMFLVGLLRTIEGELTVELLLARDYSEEAAILATLWQRVNPESVVVTFNGKSFDWPMVVDRSRRHLLHRGPRIPTPAHLDLLHVARRRWRNELPDCKLQTLERRICGRSRCDDIPGSQIPAAYMDYVRTGFEREMDLILLHNAIDLVTLLDLAMRLA